MLVFWDQRLAFLATPKTGSTAIESALESLSALVVQRPPVLKHTSVQRYHRFLGPYFEVASGHPFTVAALMREPRDWLGSWYRYRQRDDIADPNKSTIGKTFDEFVSAYCQDTPPAFAGVGSQARFLRSRKGRGVDHLFRYEDISSFIAFLEDRLGCEIILPRLNVSPPGTLDLSASTEALLNSYASEDFALYNSIARET
ncbi:hypothetical protein EOK75_13640 (plasmid) [Pseudorhodobacter turbinis]|uniref:Gamma-glutamyl kinase n=1 Tax=Pseudorhodobacter turbinis TaxID=2500533 RepID=A0A4P8EIS3_9RHOB|nr:hypothetical protein [Pseudorhodobacter turbinis]QCO56848.1 hypothetical protein EOK75_13640 [Pseudorhodobacter turbinis]